jgi:hypothetical protein
MTSVLGPSMPKVGISKQDIASPRQLVLGGLIVAGVSLVLR